MGKAGSLQRDETTSIKWCTDVHVEKVIQVLRSPGEVHLT